MSDVFQDLSWFSEALSRWREFTSSLHLLIFYETDFKSLISPLRKTKSQLSEEKEIFFRKAADSNRLINLILKYEWAVADETCSRVLESAQSSGHVDEFRTKCLYPDAEFYHLDDNNICCMIDLINYAVKLNNKQRNRCLFDNLSDAEDVFDGFFFNEPEIDRVLTWCVKFDSFWLVPDCMQIKSVPSKKFIETQEKDILETGSDCDAINESSCKICLRCKFNCYAVGVTDPEEQFKKYICDCVEKALPENCDWTRDVSLIYRLLFLSGSCRKNNKSCPCDQHYNILKKKIELLSGFVTVCM